MDALFFVFSLLIALTTGLSIGGAPKADQEVCYGDLGCFTTASPWTSSVRPLSALPEDPAIIGTQFWLNTRRNPDDSVTLVTNDAGGLTASPYDSTKRTVFLIHGWTNDANHQWITSSVKEILTNEDVNVIRVDWSRGAGLPYLRALTNTQVVGAEISLFLQFVSLESSLKLGDVHLIGHDLGAHIASYAGQRLPGIGRITALDPSTIYFEGADPLVRLDPTDALFVDVVHTDASYAQVGTDHVGLGFRSSLGHMDVYVNNGEKQPGCDDRILELTNSADKLVTMTNIPVPIDPYVCSHMRSVSYFVEAINSACPFAAYYCSSWDYYQKGVCFQPCDPGSKACTAMGYHAGEYPGRGVFYMDTQSSAPFCNEILRVDVEISSSQAKTNGKLDYIVIGDIGQTKEATHHSGSFAASSLYSLYFVWPGSNALRLGKVEAVRLLYERDGVFDETELIVQRVLVQQARYSANPTNTTMRGAILPTGNYVNLTP